jgi:hypothetical protein
MGSGGLRAAVAWASSVGDGIATTLCLGTWLVILTVGGAL